METSDIIEEPHEGERIFSTTESDVFNLEGAYLVNNRWLKRVNYYFRDSDYSLTEQHAEGEHHGQEHPGDEHQDEEHQDKEHAGEDHGDGHQGEGPTLFTNIAKEYGAIFDFTNESLAQKVVVNFVEEQVAIIGSEIFMKPAASEELTFGYFVSKDLDLLHVDFGIRYDHINRQGSINHQDGHEMSMTTRARARSSRLIKTGITSVLLSAWVEISARRSS